MMEERYEKLVKSNHSPLTPLKFYLSNKNSGFTLVELLVSVIIIGLLAATALPSFLNQATKARGSEAKSTLGSINRSQQAYRTLNGRFAAQLSELDVSPSGKFYQYDIGLINNQNAWASTPSAVSGDLKLYSAAIIQVGDFMGQVICEALTPNTPAGNANPPITPNDRGSCAPNAQVVD